MIDSRIDAMHEAVATATGRNDFGDDGYREGLRRFLGAVLATPGVSINEIAAAERTAVALLSSRLITQDSWNRNPAWRDRRVVRPLIVIGVPRTGTTALHQLLSLDPQYQGIEHWFIWGPMARPPRGSWPEQPQYQAAVKALEDWHAASPEVMAAHSAGAEEMDECLTPMAQSFQSNFLTSMHDIPDYDCWFRGQDETASYVRFLNILKLIGLSDDRRWLLKNPSHVFGIDALLRVFPDACIVQTHRHPARSIASLVSLLSGFRELAGAGPVDRALVEARETSFWAEATRRCMAAQDRQPDRFVNVWQHEIRNNPLGVVERIYRHFGLTLPPEAERRMIAWAAKNSPQAESSHIYAPVRSSDRLGEAFAPYIQRYAL